MKQALQQSPARKKEKPRRSRAKFWEVSRLSSASTRPAAQRSIRSVGRRSEAVLVPPRGIGISKVPAIAGSRKQKQPLATALARALKVKGAILDVELMLISEAIGADPRKLFTDIVRQRRTPK